jgi:hypothetical protein
MQTGQSRRVCDQIAAHCDGRPGNFIAADTEKWGKVVKTANIKPD